MLEGVEHEVASAEIKIPASHKRASLTVEVI